MFIDKVGCDGDLWDVCNAANGEQLPEPDIVSSRYHGLIITGSHFDCLSERGNAYFDWYNPILNVIRRAAEMGYPRIYGSCFGANLLAAALGGVVARNPNNRYILQVERLTMNANFQRILSSSSAQADGSFVGTEQSYEVLCTHEHHVMQLPDGAQLLGSTPYCTNHAFVMGQNDNVMGIQSHPEFDLQYCVLDRIWPSVVDKLGRLNADQIEESKQSFAAYTPDGGNRLCDAVSAFLHNE